MCVCVCEVGGGGGERVMVECNDGADRVHDQYL